MSERLFRGTTSQMLLACLYIAERGIENVALLSAQRSQWADPYFPNLKIRITKAFDENVGVDILHQLKEATATVTSTVQSAHRSLMNLKAEIEVGFKANPVRKDTLFTQLGLNKLSTHTNSQESYVTVLTILKANLTSTVKAELVQAGASASNIDTLLAQATLLIEANNVQENLKTNRKTGNKANLDALNAIHDEVSDICKLVNTYFVGNKMLLDQFNFTNALKLQGYVPSPRKKNDTPPATK